MGAHVQKTCIPKKTPVLNMDVSAGYQNLWKTAGHTPHLHHQRVAETGCQEGRTQTEFGNLLACLF
jgi:hypothetical protein